jgi:membrane protein
VTIPLRGATSRATAEGKAVVDRLIGFEIVDRSLVIGAQAFSALIPVLIVIASLGARDGSSMADSIIKRFDLSGDGADAVRRAFASPAEGDTVTVLGILVVVVSALSFTRALQRLFERTWGQEKRGVRATSWGLGWLALFALYWSLFPLVSDELNGPVRWTVSLAGTFGFWLATPYLLLARRVPGRQLLLQAALTAVGMTALTAGAGIYAPRAISQSAEQFGAIGVAFTLLSVLWAGGFVVVVAAAVGSYPFVTRRVSAP